MWLYFSARRPFSSRLLRPAKYPPHHPKRRHEYMHRIGEKSGLIAFDDMPKPRERERRRNQEQADDPMKPDHNQGRKPDWNRDQMQRAVYRMIVRAIVMRIKAHMSPSFGVRIIA